MNTVKTKESIPENQDRTVDAGILKIDESPEAHRHGETALRPSSNKVAKWSLKSTCIGPKANKEIGLPDTH
jgi:hypothetical protein